MIRVIPLALTAALLSSISWAADQPGAGEALRDNKLQDQRVPAPTGGASSGAQSPAPAASTGLSFVLQGLQLKGAKAIAPEQWQAVAQPYVGRSVGDRELGVIIAGIRQLYEDQGLGLVGLGFPAQDVSTGLVTIDVVEPRLGRIDVPLGRSAPVSADRVQGLLRFFGVSAGGALNLRDLDRVLFALNDMPGVQAKGSMTPAGDEGVYNLAIQVQAKRAWDASLTLDNQGSRFTGEWRLGAGARLNNPLGLGDNLDARTTWSTGGGVKVGRVSYELPVAYTPIRWSVGASQVDYDLRGVFADLSAHGTGRVVDTALSYPFIRSRSQTLVGRFGYEFKRMEDRVDLIALNEQKSIRSWVLSAAYEGRDNVLGGGYVGALVQWRQGQLGLNDPSAIDLDKALGRYGVHGHFYKLEAQVSRLQAITRDWSVYAAVNRQWASRNLDGAEKIALGGPGGVRAYAASEGAADQATLATLEVRWWLSQQWTVFALYDWARGERLKRPFIAEGNSFILRDAGLGLSASYPEWATVRATVAWRGSREPQSDTRDPRPRLFVSAQHAF